jgi:hypothetical protein
MMLRLSRNHYLLNHVGTAGGADNSPNFKLGVGMTFR